MCAAPSAGAEKKAKRAAPNVCAATWKDAEMRSDAGHLREARELLRSCAKPSCGAVFAQCATKLGQVETDIPTVVPVVNDDAGGPVVNVQFTVDGELMASRLDGRGLAINPGLHVFCFSTSELGVFATKTLMIVEGQRNRPIAVAIHKRGSPAIAASTGATKSVVPEKEAMIPSAAPATPTTPPTEGTSSKEASEPAPPPEPATASNLEPKKHGRSAFPYLLGGLGLASVGAGALLTLWGRQDNAALSACAPNCAASDLDHIKTLYLASDIAFGVGAAAVGVATVMLVAGGGKGREKTAHAGLTFDVAPAPSGAFATFRGTF